MKIVLRCKLFFFQVGRSWKYLDLGIKNILTLKIHGFLDARIAYKTNRLFRGLDLWSHRVRIAYETWCSWGVWNMQMQGTRIAYKTYRLWRVLKASFQGFRMAYETCRLWRVLDTGFGWFFYQKTILHPFLSFSAKLFFKLAGVENMQLGNLSLKRNSFKWMSGNYFPFKLARVENLKTYLN